MPSSSSACLALSTIPVDACSALTMKGSGAAMKASAAITYAMCARPCTICGQTDSYIYIYTVQVAIYHGNVK